MSNKLEALIKNQSNKTTVIQAANPVRFTGPFDGKKLGSRPVLPSGTPGDSGENQQPILRAKEIIVSILLVETRLVILWEKGLSIPWPAWLCVPNWKPYNRPFRKN